MYIPINNPQGGGVDISSFSGGKACVDCCDLTLIILLAIMIIISSEKAKFVY